MPVFFFIYTYLEPLPIEKQEYLRSQTPTTNHAGKGMMGPEKNDGPVEMEKTFLWETGLVRESLLKHALDSMIINDNRCKLVNNLMIP